MARSNSLDPPLRLLAPPYEQLAPLDPNHPLPPLAAGTVLTWAMAKEEWTRNAYFVNARPAGLALAVILPAETRDVPITRILRAIETARPQVVLPHHRRLSASQIAQVVKRPPHSLGTALVEYLEWRGLEVDATARAIIRRTVKLSTSVRTVGDLSRRLYMSRRALGRRFQSNGLPSPSRWLHLSRVLRATFRLQNSRVGLFHIACSLGYPDGFSLSRQMSRLCAVRPSEVRGSAGWEWVLESWLAVEAGNGSISRRIFRSRTSIARGAFDESLAQHQKRSAALVASG